MNVDKILQDIEASKAISTASRAADIAQNKYKQNAALAKEIISRGYDWQSVLNGQPDGLARECEQHLMKSLGQHYSKRNQFELIVPFEALATRVNDYVTGGTSTGGALVETKIEDFPPIAPLYPMSALLGAGAEVILTQKTNLNIPRFAFPLAATSGETTSITVGQNAFTTEEVNLNAIWYSNTITISRQIVTQAADRKITDSVVTLLKKAIGVLLDQLALTGTGQTNGIGQALGLLNYPSQSIASTNTDPGKVYTMTWGGAPTLANVTNANLGLDYGNSPDDLDDRTWIISPLTKSVWSTTQLAASYPQYIYDYKTGRVGKHKAITTTLLNVGNQSILINGNNAVFLIVDGFSLTINPYLYAGSNQLLITVGILADFGMRHACGACVSTDSAAV